MRATEVLRLAVKMWSKTDVSKHNRLEEPLSRPHSAARFAVVNCSDSNMTGMKAYRHPLDTIVARHRVPIHAQEGRILCCFCGWGTQAVGTRPENAWRKVDFVKIHWESAGDCGDMPLDDYFLRANGITAPYVTFFPFQLYCHSQCRLARQVAAETPAVESSSSFLMLDYKGFLGVNGPKKEKEQEKEEEEKEKEQEQEVIHRKNTFVGLLHSMAPAALIQLAKGSTLENLSDSRGDKEEEDEKEEVMMMHRKSTFVGLLHAMAPAALIQLAKGSNTMENLSDGRGDAEEEGEKEKEVIHRKNTTAGLLQSMKTAELFQFSERNRVEHLKRSNTVGRGDEKGKGPKLHIIQKLGRFFSQPF
eukprot:gene25062-10714_t